MTRREDLFERHGGVCRARNCKRRILWAKSELGRPMPIDPEPADDGNVRLTERLDGSILSAKVLGTHDLEVARAAGDELYATHYATCPAASSFRRR